MPRVARGPDLLILPAFALLGAVFVVPLVWFFVETLAAEGGVAALAAHAAAVLASKPVVTALITTNWISLLVTGFVLIVGYPIAYHLANSRGLGFTLVLFCVIVPYFTSLIVRTYSWMVLLGRNGLVNQALLAAGLVETPVPLLYNKFGILVGMAYVLLPYMVLTLYAAMRAIDPSLMRVARGLGASAPYAFLRVYLPLSAHGIVSGSLVVFILAIGFFVTPALMGGPSDVMIAMLIERAVEITFDWPSAAIMSLLLLAVTLILYALYCRVADLDRMLGA